MKLGMRWLFCALTGLVLLTAFSSLVAGSERPTPPHPSVAVPVHLVA